MKNKYLLLCLMVVFVATALFIGYPSKPVHADECVGDSNGNLSGFCVVITDTYIDTNGGLTFVWASGQGFDYYNVICSRPGNEDNQVAVDGNRTWFSVGNAARHHGTTYTLQVEGCNNGTFSSDCTDWSTRYFTVT